MSDHGFHPDHRRPQSLPVEPAGPARQHREQGILVLKGPGIKSDERIYGASLLDVAPTLLTIFGLPVGEDLDGKVLVEAFETPPEVVAIPSWDQVPGEDGAHPPDRALHPLEAQEAIRQFVALGYIEKPDEDQEKAVAEAERERRYNLARSYMDAGRHLEAIPYLVELARDWPDAYRFGLRLVTCYQATGQLREARKALEELVDRKARNAAAAAEQLRQWQSEHEDSAVKDLSEPEQRELRRMQVEASTNLAAVEELMGTQLLAEGDAEGALVYFQNVELMAADDATGPTKMGQAYLALKRWAEAEGKFRQALDLEAERVDAWLGLARAGLGQRRNREAAEAALTAVGLGFHNPEAHFLLGVALHRMGRVPRAVEALRVAVAQNPNHAPAHERLAFIYENRLRDAARAEEHRRLARAAADRVEQLKAGGVSTGPAQFDRRPITPPLTLLEEHRTLSREMAAPLSETIVVVSGLPRSGTSLMMQMLAAGGLEPLTDHARPADAFNVEGYYEDERAKNLARDSSWLAEARGKALKVVVPLFPQIHPGPEYSFQVILMERPLSEVLASQKDMLLGGGRTGARLTDEQLHKVFTAQVNAAKRILALARVPTLYVAYHDCVQDPRGAAARVNEFLGGSLDEAAMAAAVRPDLRHHRHIV
jgi:tetratricopeptide (TPR) repeat protein